MVIFFKHAVDCVNWYNHCGKPLAFSHLHTLEKATHSSILAWRSPWTDEPGGHGVTKSWTWLSTHKKS